MKACRNSSLFASQGANPDCCCSLKTCFPSCQCFVHLSVNMLCTSCKSFLFLQYTDDLQYMLVAHWRRAQLTPPDKPHNLVHGLHSDHPMCRASSKSTLILGCVAELSHTPVTHTCTALSSSPFTVTSPPAPPPVLAGFVAWLCGALLDHCGGQRQRVRAASRVLPTEEAVHEGQE